MVQSVQHKGETEGTKGSYQHGAQQTPQIMQFLRVEGI